MDKNAKRYMIEFGLSMALYSVTLVLSITLLKGQEGITSGNIALALMPAVPTALALASFIRYLITMDELQQRIQLLSIGFAAAVTGLLSFSYGLLENIGFPHLPLLWVAPFMIVAWGLGTWIFSKRYK